MGNLTFHLCRGSNDLPLDNSKTLLDYDVSASSKQVTIRAVKETAPAVVDMSVFLSMVNAIAANMGPSLQQQSQTQQSNASTHNAVSGVKSVHGGFDSTVATPVQQ